MSEKPIFCQLILYDKKQNSNQYKLRITDTIVLIVIVFNIKEPFQEPLLVFLVNIKQIKILGTCIEVVKRKME